MTALQTAIRKNNVEACLYLLEQGADPDSFIRRRQRQISGMNANGFIYGSPESPLYFSINLSATDEIIAAIVGAKACLNYLDRNARLSPLMLAAQNGRLDVVRALVVAKASANGRSSSGQSALELAARAMVLTAQPSGRAEYFAIITFLASD